MRTYDFTLLLSGIEPTDAAANALYEAGCDDAVFGAESGQVYLDFSRAAESLHDAVTSALRDVRSADIDGLAVTEVKEPL